MTITGYILPLSAADSVLESIGRAFDSRNLPRYWTPGKYEIFSGEHAGQYFVPADDEILDTPLTGTPPLTPRDFPEFSSLITSLGGLDARVSIEGSSITPPLTEDT